MITRLTTAEAKRLQKTLESKLKDLLSYSIVHDELRIDPESEQLERIQSQSDRDIVVQRLNLDTRLIREVRTAIVRIKNDAYGFCSECGEPIPVKRLNAIPWASSCLDCQSRIETFKAA